MQKLSEEGLRLVAKAQYKRQIDKKGQFDGPKLSIEASRVILEEVLDDIQFKESVELEKVIKDQRLRLTRETEKDATKKFNREELHNLLETRLVGNGVGQDNARKFLNGKNIGEDACKYFCKALKIPYFKAIEGCRQLKRIEIVATEFDHTEQLDQLDNLLKKKKIIPLFHNVTNDQAYLQLQWLLLRCFNQPCNLNNSETLYIKFNSNLSKKSPNEEQILENLKQQLIRQISSESLLPSERLYEKVSDWPDIARFLSKRVLFKKNVILVFCLSNWQDQTIQSFWNQLTQFLPPLRETDHYLFLVVINDIPQYYKKSNPSGFEVITVKNYFEKQDIFDWLKNQRVKKSLKIDDNNISLTTDTIWEQSQNGQPEALLKAIYENFKPKCNWDLEKQQWYNLKS